MATQKQIAANRANSAKSAGPKTATGKANARYNALRHGLLAQATILPSEDPEEFQELLRRLDEEIKPSGELESLLVDRIASCAWRLRRLLRVETGILAREEYNELAARAYAQAELFVEHPAPFRSRSVAAHPAGKIVDEARWREATAKGAAAEWDRDNEQTTAGAAFIRDASGADALSKLSRYETAIERTLYKAINELRRLREQPMLEGPAQRDPGGNGKAA